MINIGRVNHLINKYFLIIIILIEWFLGLTKAFLNVRIPKILMLAEKERMDKELTVA